MTLNAQQAAGLDKMIQWYEGTDREYSTEPLAEVFPWFGYAGTGKTYTAARIPEALGLDKVVFGTYTGKAASVLRASLARYGVHFPVTTIHSAIYFPTTSAAAREALESARAEIDDLEARDWTTWKVEDMEGARAADAHLVGLRHQLPELEANAKRLRWEFNPEGDWANADLIILDEVSMVNAKLAADIESYGVPILVLGDPAQLPPVEGGGYYTNRTPAVLLTEIQRAALDSPVTALATRIRESRDARLGMVLQDMRAKSLRDAMSADMVLVWTNKRRWSMITAMRTKLGRQPGVPAAGDVIMNLTNNKDAAVFNGQVFTVLRAQQAGDARLGWDLKVLGEDGQERELKAYAEGFIDQDEQTKAKNVGLGMRGDRLLMTFAQAITVHKAQGSEADRVYVVNETPGMISMTAKREGTGEALAQARRWLYTAVTRAKGEVIVSLP